jgi:hypothetical protein
VPIVFVDFRVASHVYIRCVVAPEVALERVSFTQDKLWINLKAITLCIRKVNLVVVDEGEPLFLLRDRFDKR